MIKVVIVSREPENIFLNGWDFVPEDNSWYSVYPLGFSNPNLFIHAYEMARTDEFIALVVFCAKPEYEEYVHELIDNSLNSWTVSELKEDTSDLAMEIKNAWSFRQGENLKMYDSMFGYSYPEDIED